MLFAQHLDGRRLMSNARHLRGSAWLNFPRVACERWYHGNVVLLGDAAHTAHFSVGSGTKLALEDAIGLAEALHAGRDLESALAAYQESRRVEVLKLQSAARNSTEWFEAVPRYVRFEPLQFAYALLTRSQRVSHENLRLRDRTWLEGMERWFAERVERAPGAAARAADVHAVPPARARARQPHRGLADGDVLGRGRHSGRLPPRAPRHARPGRRRARVHRDDLRRARGAHHAGLRRHVQGRARRRLDAHRRLRAPAQPRPRSACSSAIRAPRARPSSAGRAWTSRWRRATGR